MFNQYARFNGNEITIKFFDYEKDEHSQKTISDVRWLL